MEIDLAVGAFASLGEKIDGLGNRFPKVTTPRGLHKKAVGTIVTPASITGAIALQVNTGPAKGRVWNITSVGVYGADGHTVVATMIADVFAGDFGPIQQFTTEVNPVLSDILIGGQPVPFTATFSKEIYWCRYGEVPYALLYTAPASTQFILKVTYTDFELEAVEEMYVP